MAGWSWTELLLAGAPNLTWATKLISTAILEVVVAVLVPRAARLLTCHPRAPWSGVHLVSSPGLLLIPLLLSTALPARVPCAGRAPEIKVTLYHITGPVFPRFAVLPSTRTCPSLTTFFLLILLDPVPFCLRQLVWVFLARPQGGLEVEFPRELVPEGLEVLEGLPPVHPAAASPALLWKPRQPSWEALVARFRSSHPSPAARLRAQTPLLACLSLVMGGADGAPALGSTALPLVGDRASTVRTTATFAIVASTPSSRTLAVLLTVHLQVQCNMVLRLLVKYEHMDFDIPKVLLCRVKSSAIYSGSKPNYSPPDHQQHPLDPTQPVLSHPPHFPF